MTARSGAWRSWCVFGAVTLVACAHAADEVEEPTPSTSKSGAHAGGKAGAAGTNTGGSSAGTPAAPAGGDASGNTPGGGRAGTSAGGGDAGGSPEISADGGAEPTEPAGGAGPSSASDLTVLYKTGSGSPTDNQIRMGLRIVSSEKAGAMLSSLELRYYFTSEVALPLQIEIYDAAINGAAGYRTLAKEALKTDVTSTDGYLDVTFTSAAGSLQAGESLTLDLVIHGPNWTGNFSETDDYSFAADHTDFAAWNHVTLFSGKSLVWGIEPP